MEDDLPYSGREIYSTKSISVTNDPLDMDCSNIIQVKAGQRVRISFLAFDVEMDYFSLNW